MSEVWVLMCHDPWAGDAWVQGVYSSREAAKADLRLPDMTQEHYMREPKPTWSDSEDSSRSYSGGYTITRHPVDEVMFSRG